MHSAPAGLRLGANCTPGEVCSAGEEYLAYNRRRWGGDGWTHDLRRSGAPDGAAFSNWQWWPNTLKASPLCWHSCWPTSCHAPRLFSLMLRGFEAGPDARCCPAPAMPSTANYRRPGCPACNQPPCRATGW